MDYDIRNKVVLITGGATGIGFACVQELLRNGARGITIVSRNKTKGENAIATFENQFGPNKVIFVQTDVTEYAQLQHAYETTMKTWKAIDIVINNAGLMKDCEWEKEIAINCNGVVQSTLLAIRYMRKDCGGNGGTIVNVSSILGIMPVDGSPIYVATKHFITAFSRSLGTQYHFDHTGVRILILCPSGTDTALLAGAEMCALSELAPDITERFGIQIQAVEIQSADHVAKGLITILKKAENGSCWMSQHDEPIYEIEIPFVQLKNKY